MKKRLKFKIVSLFAFVLLISCSSDESHDIANLTTYVPSSNVIALRKEFVDIMKTNAFTNKQAKFNIFSNALVNSPVTQTSFQTRTNFQTFLNNNLSSTKFVSVNDGLRAYDDARTASNVYFSSVNVFNQKLLGLQLEDVRYILSPFFTTPSSNAVTSTHDEECMDTVISTTDVLDNWYCEMMNNGSGPNETGVFLIEVWYNMRLTKAIAEFNDCLNED